MGEPDDPSDPNKPPPRPVVAEVFAERPEAWKPDPGHSRANAQSDGPLAAVELANFGVPEPTGESAPPVDTVQMPPHRSSGAPSQVPEATVELAPHRAGEQAGEQAGDESGEEFGEILVENVERFETLQMPPHRGRAETPPSFDQTMELPSRRRRALAPEPFESTLELTPEARPAPTVGTKAQAARRDRNTAAVVLVFGLLMVGALWAGLHQNTPEAQRAEGPLSPRTTVYGGGGGGGGRHGAGGSGGPRVGLRTPDSELLADATGDNACVARCARRQARCAQACRAQEKCRTQCIDALTQCENGCGGGAELAGEKDSAPTLTAAQKAAAGRLCHDDEGALVPCANQEAKLERAEAIVRKMCGRDPDFPCPTP